MFFSRICSLVCSAIIALSAAPAQAGDEFASWIVRNYQVKQSLATRIAHLPLMKSVDSMSDAELHNARVARKDLPLVKRELVATLLKIEDDDIEPMILRSAFRNRRILISMEGPPDYAYAASGYSQEEIELRVKQGLRGFIRATGIKLSIAIDAKNRREADLRIKIAQLIIPDNSAFVKAEKVKSVRFGAGDYQFDTSQGSPQVAMERHTRLGAHLPSSAKGLVGINLFPFLEIYKSMKGDVNDRLAHYSEGIPEMVYHEMIHATCFYGNISSKGKQGHSMNSGSLMNPQMEPGYSRKLHVGSTLRSDEVLYLQRNGYQYTEKSWKPEDDISAKATRVLLELY